MWNTSTNSVKEVSSWNLVHSEAFVLLGLESVHDTGKEGRYVGYSLGAEGTKGIHTDPVKSLPI